MSVLIKSQSVAVGIMMTSSGALPSPHSRKTGVQGELHMSLLHVRNGSSNWRTGCRTCRCTWCCVDSSAIPLKVVRWQAFAHASPLQQHSATTLNVVFECPVCELADCVLDSPSYSAPRVFLSFVALACSWVHRGISRLSVRAFEAKRSEAKHFNALENISNHFVCSRIKTKIKCFSFFNIF